MPNYIKNIAIVGRSYQLEVATRSVTTGWLTFTGDGNLGTLTVQELLNTNHFNITGVTRTSSSSTYPSHGHLMVKTGDYGDRAFLVSPLKGQDALIMMLGFMTPSEQLYNIIEAAAEVGVPWILSVEYSSDTQSDVVNERVPLLIVKTQCRDKIVELGKSSFIAVVDNPWTDYCFASGGWRIDIKKRTATLLDGGKNKFYTTTTSTVALAIARLLSLPVTAPAGQPSLSDYKNGWIYIRSFYTSQRELLDAVQRATGTSDADWKIEERSLKEDIAEGREDLQRGDVLNGVTKTVMTPGEGDVYSGRPLANDVLGLPREDLDEVARKVVRDLGT